MQFINALRAILDQHSLLGKKASIIKVLIICDPGVDDLLMLLQILSSSLYSVEGIIPVQGNTTCFHAVQNTLKVCELLGKFDIGIYAGSNYDKFASSQPAETAVYGENGLNSLELPPANQMKLKMKNGVDFVCDSLSNDKYLLVSTAPLTELATILNRLNKQTPKALKNIIAISMMGGVINQTQEANWPIHGERCSEANIGYDGPASKKVFDICTEHQVPIFLAPLDLTHSILASNNDIAFLKTIENVAGNLAVKLIENVPKHYQQRYQKGPDCQYRQPLHDVHAVSCLLHPEIYYGKWVTLTINDHIGPQHTEAHDNTKGNVYLLDMHYMHRQEFFFNFAHDLKNYV